ncbi:PAAR domain-containing protein [Luteimonas sp. RD2P54]|uniref:PAAR domain-containing protein n=1 Tax=Luteimonas endophytica TaxID=3042023 RepID=A0ABT6J9N9_9GAMM|nr:PAAR domain-containing protein [Luteimonas endophytica]MDH5823547.1 PAAR domain-containing protein [Luteimonas endophytica]
MARMWIVVGDATSSGGRVITGSPFTDIDGKPVARVNDQAICPLHKGAFPIVDGDSTTIIDGQPVALHGSSLACGCKVLAVQQSRVFIDTGASGAAAVAQVPQAVPLRAATDTAADYDEGFVLRSSLTGQPLANRNYRVFHADGRCETGTTDAESATHIVKSNCCETLRIELEEEGP